MARVLSRFAGARRHFLDGAAVALVFSALLAPAAHAEPRYPGDRGDTASRRQAEKPRGPLLTVVSLAKQRVKVYDANGVVAQSPVSTGMAGHRTPAGVFTILQKSRHHRSNIYSNAPMPYMQRLTWSGVALHAGVLPGYPASHGCIRMPHAFASELWGLIGMGSRVVVAPDDASAAPIEHAQLPSAKLLPAPVMAVSPGDGETEVAAVTGATMTDAGGSAAGAPLLNPVERAKALKSFFAKDAADKTRAAQAAEETASERRSEARRAGAVLDAAETSLASARRRHENAARDAARVAEAAAKAAEAAATASEAAIKLAATPAVVDISGRSKEAAERAAERALAAAERAAERASDAAAKAEDAAKEKADEKVQRAKAEVEQATERLKQATERADARAREAAERAARRARETAERAAERTAEAAARAQQATVRATEDLDKAQADLAYAVRTLQEARLLDAMAGAEAAAAAAVAAETETARRAAAHALKVAEKAGEPISIFVSRKAGKVRIRQGWLPIHEAPVAFIEDGPRLGTHIFLATGPEADGESMKWLSVSLPSSGPDPFRSRGRGAAKAPADQVPYEDATSVLNRFTLPAASRRFIEERLWTGATLIVSDNDISHETGQHTDFVVLMR